MNNKTQKTNETTKQVKTYSAANRLTVKDLSSLDKKTKTALDLQFKNPILAIKALSKVYINNEVLNKVTKKFTQSDYITLLSICTPSTTWVSAEQLEKLEYAETIEEIKKADYRVKTIFKMVAKDDESTDVPTVAKVEVYLIPSVKACNTPKAIFTYLTATKTSKQIEKLNPLESTMYLRFIEQRNEVLSILANA